MNAPRFLLLLALATLVGIGLFACVGEVPDRQLAIMAALEMFARGGVIAGAYVGAGVGLGLGGSYLLRSLSKAEAYNTPPIISALIGCGVLLTYSHGVGVLGVMDSLTAYAPIVVGWCGLAWVITRSRVAIAATILPKALWLWVPPCALMFLAATNSPGYLWESEFGGYDALSYHLQLPVEWDRMHCIAPVEHNVYSYLPGYIEAAFYHIGALIQPLSPTAPLLAGQGEGLIACQLVHAFLTLLGAVAVMHLICDVLTLLRPNTAFANADSQPQAVISEVGGKGDDSHILSISAALAAVYLATPWIVVVGSLAYNEGAMLAFFAAALVAAIHARHHPVLAWICAAFLVGCAACCKPTALFMCGVPVGLILVVCTRAASARGGTEVENSLGRAKLAGSVRGMWTTLLVGLGLGTLVGVLTLAPWLVRNYTSTGNPVFPFAAGLFSNQQGGTGHWTAEQVTRFAAGHSFDGTLWDAARLTLLRDYSDPAGPRHRGALHVQWFLFFPIVVLLLIMLAIRVVQRNTWEMLGALRGRSHPTPKLLILGFMAAFLVQYALWLTTTHVQSRFLLPLIIPGLVIAAASSIMFGSSPARVLTRAFALLQMAGLAWVFTGTRDGAPNLLLTARVPDRTGEVLRPLFADRSNITQELLDTLTPEHAVNLLLPADRNITLIGSATPLYFSGNVRYATTWDTWPALSPQGYPLEATPGDYLLVDLSELQRLGRSGFAPKDFDVLALSMWLQGTSDPGSPPATPSIRARILKTWPQLGQVLVQVVPGT
jgi:hypothetical protein